MSPCGSNEGLAMYESGEGRWTRWQTLSLAAFGDRLLPLSELDKAFPRDSSGVGLAYAESADVIRFLARDDGSRALRLARPAGSSWGRIQSRPGGRLRHRRSQARVRVARGREEASSTCFLFLPAAACSGGVVTGALLVAAWVRRRRQGEGEARGVGARRGGDGHRARGGVRCDRGFREPGCGRRGAAEDAIDPGRRARRPLAHAALVPFGRSPTGFPGLGAVRPAEGPVGAQVPEDVGGDPIGQFVGRRKRPASDHAALKDREPAFDLVEPGGVLSRRISGLDSGIRSSHSLTSGVSCADRLSITECAAPGGDAQIPADRAGR